MSLEHIATFFRDFKEYAFLAVMAVAVVKLWAENKKKEAVILELALTSQQARLKTAEAVREMRDVLTKLLPGGRT